MKPGEMKLKTLALLRQEALPVTLAVFLAVVVSYLIIYAPRLK